MSERFGRPRALRGRVTLAKYLCALIAAAALTAKGAELTGAVVDPSGAPVAGVVVQIQGGGFSREAATDETGEFRFTKIPARQYRLTIAQPPFKAMTRSVKAGARAEPLQIELEIEEVRNEITVTEQAPGVSTQPSDNLNAVTIGEEEIRDLPVLGSDYVSVLEELTGGAAGDPAGSTVVVDGVEMDVGSIPMEAIQHVRINRDPYTAEFARPGRGRIEITTRQGTNDFHGSLNVGVRNSVLDARNPFAPERPDESRRRFAGYLSGPIRKDGRTSFMFAGEREQNDLQSLVYARTPSGLFSQQVQTPDDETEFMLKIRQLVGDTHVFSFRVDREQRNYENQGVGGFSLPELAITERRQDQALRLQHTAFISPELISDLSVEWQTDESNAASVRAGVPRLVVVDAFSSGGAQVDRTSTEKEIGLKYVVSWSKGRHLIRGGVDVPDWNWQTYTDLSNRQGTFYFSSLEQFQNGQPYSFVQQTGNPRIRFHQRAVGFFVQDTVQLRPGLTAGVGLRYDRQNYLNTASNFAPRLSLAWSPGSNGKNVFRAGFGIFYDRLRSGTLQDILLLGGTVSNELIISDPGYPDPYTGGTEAAMPPPSIVRAAGDLRSPYLTRFSLSWERRLGSRTTFSATYAGMRGVSLFRSRDVNAPVAPLFVRPDPELGLLRQIESSGTMKSHSLEVGVSGRFSRFFNGMVRYELGSVRSNVDGINTLPANSYNIGSEWGRSSRDRRHGFRAIGRVNFFDWFQTGVIMRIDSGAPYNLITGRDENRDGIANDRPEGVGRNTLVGPGYVRLDLRWTKEIDLSRNRQTDSKRGPTLAFNVDAFNVLNQVNYAGYVGNLSSPFFGQPVASRPARRVQLGMRFSF